MKMKWEKARIDIYNIAGLDVITVSDEDPNENRDDCDEDIFHG